VAASLAVMAAAESRPVFSVGALRRDGIVIPFATYDKNHWETNWPVPKLDMTSPSTFAPCRPAGGDRRRRLARGRLGSAGRRRRPST
jgi:hypothetical protein